MIHQLEEESFTETQNEFSSGFERFNIDSRRVYGVLTIADVLSFSLHETPSLHVNSFNGWKSRNEESEEFKDTYLNIPIYCWHFMIRRLYSVANSGFMTGLYKQFKLLIRDAKFPEDDTPRFMINISLLALDEEHCLYNIVDTSCLFQAQESLKRIKESIGEGVAEWDYLRETMNANDKWYEIVGNSKNDKISFKSMKDRIHPEDSKAYEGYFQSRLFGTKDYGKVSSYRLYNMKKDEYVWCSSSFRVTKKSNLGIPLVVTSIKQDINNMKNAQLAAESYQKELFEVLKNVPAPIFIMDSQCRVSYINPAYEQFTGKSLSQVEGTKWTGTLYEKSDHEEVKRMIYEFNRSLKEKKLTSSRTHLLGPDMRKIDVRVDFHPTKSQDSFYGVLSDISDIIKFNVLLEDRNQELKAAISKKDLALDSQNLVFNSISHEICTPLNGIMGNVALLKQNLYSHDEQISDILASITQCSQSLSDTVMQILKYSITLSDTTGNFDKLFPDKVDLVRFILDIIDSIMNTEKFKDCKIDCNFDNLPTHIKSPAQIRLNGFFVQHIMKNLITNGLDFNENRWARVKVSLESESDANQETYLFFEVLDNGKGIEEYKQRKIFEPFYRSNFSDGKGMGLPLSQRYAEQLGTKIQFHSRHLEGSRFWIYIPIKMEESLHRNICSTEGCPRDTYTKEIANGHSIENGNLLVVEDNIINQRIMVRMLAKIGFGNQKTKIQVGNRTPKTYRVDLASNGAEAMIKARENMYDLILMDISLPDINGDEVAQMIKANTKSKKSYIIAVTANFVEYGEEALDPKGINVCLHKPITIEALRNVINRAD